MSFPLDSAFVENRVGLIHPSKRLHVLTQGLVQSRHSENVLSYCWIFNSPKVLGREGNVCYYSYHGHENTKMQTSPGAFPPNCLVVE